MRWLERVERELGKSLGRAPLRDAMPNYLTTLSDALRSGGSMQRRGKAAWEDIAREHALVRVRLGFDVDELVHELVANHFGQGLGAAPKPLSAAKLAAARLRRSASKKDARLFDVVEQNMNRLEGLIDSVLDMERLQAGKIEPHVRAQREVRHNGQDERRSQEPHVDRRVRFSPAR